METAQQLFCNKSDRPLTIVIEFCDEGYELRPGETMTLTFDVGVEGNALQMDYLSQDRIVIWPNGECPTVVISPTENGPL